MSLNIFLILIMIYDTAGVFFILQVSSKLLVLQLMPDCPWHWPNPLENHTSLCLESFWHF